MSFFYLVISVTLWLGVVVFPWMTTPLTMCICLGGYSVGIVLSIGMAVSSWLGLLVGLVYISGLNVLFMYFVATSLSDKPSLSGLATVMVVMFFGAAWAVMEANSDWLTLYSEVPSMGEVCKFYVGSFISFLFLLGLVLFLIMVAVVKVSGRNYGPLRGFF